MRHAAEHAEAAGLDHIWVVDHVAIPPDDAEGSNGRWIDPLASLAFFAAATHRVDLGVAVLVLPYRPALPTAKWIASIQELSGGRLLFGVGPGWMTPEFQALGVDKRRRGPLTDDVLNFIRECFDAPDDIVTANGQAFLFRPKPQRPPIYVGGMTEAALARAIKYGDGWLPMGIDPAKLKPKVERLRELAAAAGRECPDLVLIGSLPDDQTAAVEQLAACRELGATDYIQASRYANENEFDTILARIEDVKRQLG
jgi:probable F420-dependent oxidoreductase